MGISTYSFGRFSLNPLARTLLQGDELIRLPASAFDCLVYLIEHRDRPIGRDELIAAIWGRVEVSDNLLAQHIVRLRRILGDDAPYIRTVPRVGYHWVALTTIKVLSSNPKDALLPRSPSAPTTPCPPTPIAERNKHFVAWIIAAVALCAAALSSRWWSSTERSAADAYQPQPEARVVVLPAKIKAPDEWSWLRYGLMDMVANHLKEAGVKTVPSDAVVAVFRDYGLAGNEAEMAQRLQAAWQVEPTIEHADSGWRIHLDLRSPSGQAEGLDATSDDMLVAATNVSNLLLARLGRPTAQEGGGVTPLDGWMAKIAAARTNGDLDVAQKLIDDTPKEWRADPRIDYITAALECDRGQRDVCERHLNVLLTRLPADKDPVLRGQAMYLLAMRYANCGQMDKGAKIMDEALGLLERGKTNDFLGNAYLARAWLAQSHGQLDMASTYIGKGRAVYAISGNVHGMARADFELGMIIAAQGQLDSAMVFLRRAHDQLAQLGHPVMLPSVLDSMASVAKLQLKFSDELAMTDHFWPLGADLIDVHVRRELTYARAMALADNGRLMEAASLANELDGDLDPHEDSWLASEVPALLAQVAYSSGHWAEAARQARLALRRGGLGDVDRATTWLVLSRALRQSGQWEQALSETRQFKAWADAQPRRDAWHLAYADLAEAELLASRDPPRGRALLATLMPRAQKEGVPELIVSVGCAYAAALLKAGQVDEATAVGGMLSAWSQEDPRVATLQAGIHEALGQTDALRDSLQQAKKILAERVKPNL